MSVLTKVFVVLLVVMSIALSMLVIAAFSQQENWKASAADWRVAALASQAKERTVTANAALEQQRALDRHQQDVALSNDLKAELLTKNEQLADLDARVDDLENKLNVEQGQVTSAEQLNGLLQAASNREQEFIAKLSRRNSELERRNVDLNDRVQELTANMAMAKSRVHALKQQIAAMTESRSSGGLANAVQIPGGPGIVQPHTPTVTPASVVSSMTSPIRGEITSVRGDLASISVGSADGVAQSMTFLIYRTGAKDSGPQYLGTLRITRVQANQSAGTIEQSVGEIRSGDLARDEASFALAG